MQNIELLNKDEAAARARIKAPTLMRHVNAGTGPAVVKLGGRVLFTAEDIREWISAQRVPAGLAKPVA